MKATRILLFLSPLLLFVPPLLPVADNSGLAMLDMFYKGMLGRFPWNALMAFLCYTYAAQLGREAWPWVTGSLFFPFLAPLILAFMSPRYGSSADQQRRAGGRAVAAKAATGPFAESGCFFLSLFQLPTTVRICVTKVCPASVRDSRSLVKCDCCTGLVSSAALYFAIHASSGCSNRMRFVSIAVPHIDGRCLSMPYTLSAQLEIHSERTTSIGWFESRGCRSESRRPHFLLVGCKAN